jgi:tripartite-type tricarboxylate transporter receptor subunit TctC
MDGRVTMPLSRRALLQAAARATLAAPFVRPIAASAQDVWPNRPLRFVVPLAPGGGLDFVARLIGDPLGRRLGQQIVVENRTGAGGTIGVETVIKSPPDGYTVLVSNDNVVSAPPILKLNVDYVKELIPVALMSRQPQALAVHPSLPVGSVADLVQLARRQPGMSYATSGAGTNQHVLAEWFAQTAGIRLEHVPYRGAGQAVNDVLAGHVKLAFLGPAALLPHHAAGKLRILAQSSPKRSPTLAEVPTLVEAGYQELYLESWYGAFLPKGTPAAVAARLNVEIGAVLGDAGLRERLGQSTMEAGGGSPEEFARLVQDYADKYARLAKEVNLKL